MSDLYKPVSEKGAPVFLTNSDQVPHIQLADGTIIAPTDSGASNDRKHTYRFPQLDARTMGSFRFVTSSGQPLSGDLTGTQRYEGSSFNNLSPTSGAGNLGSGGADGGGEGSPSFGGSERVAPPVFFDSSGLFAPQITSNNVPVIRQDIFGTVNQASDRQDQRFIDSFATARDIARENFDEAKLRLPEINDFNARETRRGFQAANPNGEQLLSNLERNLLAASNGRLPDNVENEVLNASSRQLAAENSSLVGGGISSSFGQRVANQLNIAQRLGLQQNALSQGPGFLANAVQLRRGSPQLLQYNPNEVQGLARDLFNVGSFTPAQAVNAEFTNISREDNTNRFNETNRRTAEQFNQTSAADFAFQSATIDFQNAQRQQQYDQQVINAEVQGQADQNTYDSQGRVIISEQQAREQGLEQDRNGNLIDVAGNIVALADRYVFGNNDPSDAVPTNTTTTPDVSTPPFFPPNDGVGPGGQAPPTQENSPPITEDAPLPETSLPENGVNSQPDGSVGTTDNPNGTFTDADYQDYDADTTDGLRTIDREAYEISGLSTPTTQFDITNGGEQARQFHRNARANTVQLISPQELSSDQIQYKDGSTGYNPQRPPTEVAKVQSPVPANITPNNLSSPTTYKNYVSSYMGTPSKVSRPSFSSSFWTQKPTESTGYTFPVSNPTSNDNTASALNIVAELPIQIPEEVTGDPQDAIRFLLEGFLNFDNNGGGTTPLI